MQCLVIHQRHYQYVYIKLIVVQNVLQLQDYNLLHCVLQPGS